MMHIRWKPLEAALACVGSVADALLDMRDEESDEGVAESFDLENLFKEVVPNLLNSSGRGPGEQSLEGSALTELFLNRCRFAIPTRSSIRLCEPIRVDVGRDGHQRAIP